jgi:tetratricopeptide (TPR) repeat protein
MTTRQPATRSTELLAQINSLSVRDRDNSFLLKSLERQVRQVLGAGDFAGGYTLLGALAAVRGSVEEARSHHGKAASAAPGDPGIFRNYAISLLKLGLIDEAIAMADRSWRLDKSQGDNFSLLIQMILHTGRIQEALERLHAEEEVSGEGSTLVAELESAAKFLATHGISDSISGVIAGAALQVVPPISITGVQNRVATDDETTWVDFALCVDDSFEKVMELNRTLADRMAELTLDSEIGRASAAFVVRFTRTVSLDASSSS